MNVVAQRACYLCSAAAHTALKSGVPICNGCDVREFGRVELVWQSLGEVESVHVTTRVHPLTASDFYNTKADESTKREIERAINEWCAIAEESCSPFAQEASSEVANHVFALRKLLDRYRFP